MKKTIKKYCKTILQLKYLRHFNYFFVELGFTTSREILRLLNGPHHHRENPWRGSSLQNFLLRKKVKEDHSSWINYIRYLRQHVATYEFQPKISILLPVYKPEPRYLQEAIESVLAQSYQNYELCIVDDGGDSEEIDRLIEHFRRSREEKIKYLKHEKNRHISAATNSCFSLANGEYVTLLDHDDRLKPNALAEVVRNLEFNDFPEILYSDEEIIDEKGVVQGTVFKPGWSEFLHLSKNYTTHLSVYKSTLIDKIRGWRVGMEGAQDHDFMLRAVEAAELPICHVPISLYQWRAHAASTAQDGDTKPYAATAGMKAVQEACERRGFKAQVDFEAKYFQYRIIPVLPEGSPKVSIIIPNRDSYEYIAVCLRSVFELSRYPNFEVILVDNNSSDPRCLALYEEFRNTYPDRFTVVEDKDYFNFARLNNNGVKKSGGEYLVFLNSDTEVMHDDWLEGLLGLAQLEKVGAVGCKLYFGNGPIQHAGIYGAGRDLAGHSGKLLPPEADLPLAINNCIHECLGVTAACLMIAREKFEMIGGFEETHAPNGFGDVIFGISLLEHGLVNLYTPYVELKHYESITRGKNIEMYERNYLCRKYPNYLLMDPYYNLNYSYNDHYIVSDNYRMPDLPKNWLEMDFSRSA